MKTILCIGYTKLFVDNGFVELNDVVKLAGALKPVRSITGNKFRIEPADESISVLVVSDDAVVPEIKEDE